MRYCIDVRCKVHAGRRDIFLVDPRDAKRRLLRDFARMVTGAALAVGGDSAHNAA